ncbi:MAG: tripartite tricarboxylate transporter substrate binding protein [Burkholderiales bacterium]|nr:tripartite tricarboxylate transporter substrate binding protein [Burkholderiales bacterium]MCW5603438.1 tripartite tricarboxylate transporter substrate binding protein [Burkholderiales bacterium]
MKAPPKAAFTIAALLATGLAQHAQAQSYPNKPIRILIPFVAGGFSDIVGRIVAQKLSESLGQPVVSDNRPGASGIIGTDIVAKSAPDGYTLLLSSFNHVVNPSLMNPPYDPIRDFSAISLIADGPPLVMMVSPSSPFKTVQQLISLAKASPGKLNYGSTGVGTSGHLIGELFKQEAGIDIVHVPYRGSSLSIPAVISGEVAMISTYMPTALPHAKAGRLRAIAVTGAKRSAVMPDMPTMAEAGVNGVVVSGFAGFLGPAGMSPALVRRLHGEIVKMSKNPDFVKRYESFDMTPLASTPQELVTYTREEIAKWTKVIKTAGITMK